MMLPKYHWFASWLTSSSGQLDHCPKHRQAGDEAKAFMAPQPARATGRTPGRFMIDYRQQVKRARRKL